MKAYIVIVFYTLFLTCGAQLSKRIDQSLTIQCQCEDTSICNWYYNDQSVPSQWVQDNGDLLLPANDWNVYGVIIGQCGSEFYTNVITNPGMCILSMSIMICLAICLSIYVTGFAKMCIVRTITNI